MSIFITGFWVLTVICIILYFATQSALPTNNDASFRQFQRTYLVVYMLAMAGDWLQGPYVYALYDHYGMSTHDIEVLFVAGFGSSMICGTVIGSIADKYGRRANCILYGVLYGLACVTKHFNNYWILMIGRLLGGTATSILYSAFESWLVYEHHQRGYSDDMLSSIFSCAVLGNSLVAILAGLVAQQFANTFGFVAPFDVSLAILIIMVILLVFTWTENYGDSKANIGASFKSAWKTIREDPKVLCLGLIQSLFEGSMYTFVLEWTPALQPAKQTGDNTTIPHGYIFAGFMVAVMIGSSFFKLLSKYSKVESFMRPVLLVSAVSLVTPIMYPGNQLIIFAGFLVFEMCVGIFWPALGTMRGKYVPEAARATVMNFFRVPLNLIVVIILTQNLQMAMIFKCCVTFLLIATACQQWLHRLYLQLPPTPTAGQNEVKENLDRKAPPEESENLLNEKSTPVDNI